MHISMLSTNIIFSTLDRLHRFLTQYNMSQGGRHWGGRGLQPPTFPSRIIQCYFSHVTSIQTICDAMNKKDILKDMLPTVHNLLCLYFTIPVTSATSERTLSALKRVLTYVRSTMTEKRLNDCLFLHIHKDLTDSLDLTSVAMEFINY